MFSESIFLESASPEREAEAANVLGSEGCHGAAFRHLSLCSASDHRTLCWCERMIKPSRLSDFGEPRQHGRCNGYA